MATKTTKILARCRRKQPTSCVMCPNFLNCMQIRSRKIDYQYIMFHKYGEKVLKATSRLLILISFLTVVGFKSYAGNSNDTINMEEKNTLKEASVTYVNDEEVYSQEPTIEVNFDALERVTNSIESAEVTESEMESETKLETESEVETEAEVETEIETEIETETKVEEVEAETSETITTSVAVLSAYGASETYYYDVTDDEKLELAKLVWKEARGECLEGKVAVVATVFNRLNSGKSEFDTSSIHSVITQSGAYASIKNVDASKIDDECYEAVELALKGYDPTREMFPDGGAYFFYNPNGNLSEKIRKEREGIQVLVIGNHCFHADIN